jgi:CBS domain-containing protein
MIDQSAADVMRHSVRTVAEGETASALAGLFVEHGVGSAVVLSEDGSVAGIVTESDLTRLLAADADVRTTPVGSFMTSPVVTLGSGESIHTAAALMRDNRIRRLPIVDDGELVGILTAADLTYYIPRLRDAISRERNALSRR